MNDNKDAFTTNHYFERTAFLYINLILPLMNLIKVDPTMIFT